ncbi:MAG: hypothetical protein ACTSYN_03565 [Candidatus Heimdallarchaeaceae archaeon]
MSDSTSKKRRVRRKPLKTKPAVVVKQKKIKRKGQKIHLPTLMPKGLTKWNYIFTGVFTALFVATLVNTYFHEFLVIPVKGFFFDMIIQVVIFVEILLVLVAFETYKIGIAKTTIRVIFFIITGFVLFPITLIKYYTRHNVWRILFTGFAIWTLLFSFLSPYVNLIGKYRDLPEGSLNEQNVNADWFSSLYQGSAPFYIDGLLDLLDALDLNETLQKQDMAHITSISGDLGNFLYRWEVYDYYNPTTWEFEGSNDAILYDLNSCFYGAPTGNITHFTVKQTVYSATTSLQSSLLTTWSANYYPHIDQDSDWDDNFYDENDTAISARDGTAKIRMNQRDQLSLTAVMNQLGFVGSFEYSTYFVEDDIQSIINNVVTKSESTMGTAQFNSTYDNFLQIPNNYETTSPSVVAYARQLRDDSLNVYQQVVTDIESVLLRFGVPQSAQSDNEGQDRAQRLMDGEDYSVSAYLALIVMILRLQGIPTRPVFGFAIGDGTATERDLKLGHLYAWVECLLPIRISGDVVYRWGQFQIGPYPHNNQLIYCENTLYASYNVTVSMLETDTSAELPTQTINGNDVYLADNDVTYTLQAYVSNDGEAVPNVPITFRIYTAEQLQQIQAGQTDYASVGDYIGIATTNSSGYASLTKSFNTTAYPLFDLQNPDTTSFVLLGMASLTSIDYKGFIILPVGYLTYLSMNATKQTLPNPQNPLETFDYYILQPGWQYNVSCYLYKEETLTTPLVSRTVTYYLLTQQQLQQLQTTGEIDFQSLTKIGVGKTDATGFSSVNTINTTTGEDCLQDLSLNTTYVIAAQYGQSYNFTVIILIDGLRSTVLINDTTLDTSTDGYSIGEHVEGLLYLQTPLGAKDYLENEPVEIWIVPLDQYQSYDGTQNATVYQNALRTVNDSYAPSGPYKIRVVGNTITNSSGGYSLDFVLDATQLGTGSYKLIIFYSGRWNGSDTIVISAPPALQLSDSDHVPQFNFRLPFEFLTALNKYIILFAPFIYLFVIVCLSNRNKSQKFLKNRDLIYYSNSFYLNKNLKKNNFKEVYLEERK